MLLVPHRGDEGDETEPPADYRKILVTVQGADGPVQVRAVGEELGLEVEPLRAKMTKLADRGWLQNETHLLELATRLPESGNRPNRRTKAAAPRRQRWPLEVPAVAL